MSRTQGLAPPIPAQQLRHLSAPERGGCIDRMIAYQLTPLLTELGATSTEEIFAASCILYGRWACEGTVDLSPLVHLTGATGEAFSQKAHEMLQAIDSLVSRATMHPNLPELVEVEMADRRVA